jgi:hypothetical protein
VHVKLQDVSFVACLRIGITRRCFTGELAAISEHNFVAHLSSSCHATCADKFSQRLGMDVRLYAGV